MKSTNLKELSSYTVAKNCTDLTDVEQGIKELKDYFAACEKAGKKPSITAYTRFVKLHNKKDKLEALGALEEQAFYAPLSVRRNAKKALKRHTELNSSKRGMTATGLARAKQLAENQSLSIDDLREIRAWFARHYEISYKSPAYALRERAWVAWHAWGGTEGRNWVRETLRHLENQ